MKIPEWEDCERKNREVGELTALEQFILTNEPAGFDSVVFRVDLQAVIDEVEKSNETT